jgi:hypothetical protein
MTITSHIEISATVISSSSSSLSPLEQPWDWQSILTEKIAKSKARRQQQESEDEAQDNDEDEPGYFSAIDIQPEDLVPSPSVPLLPLRAQYTVDSSHSRSKGKGKAKLSPRTAATARHQAKVDRAKKAMDKAVAQADKAMKAAQLAQDKLQQMESEVVILPKKRSGPVVVGKRSRIKVVDSSIGR